MSCLSNIVPAIMGSIILSYLTLKDIAKLERGVVCSALKSYILDSLKFLSLTSKQYDTIRIISNRYILLRWLIKRRIKFASIQLLPVDDQCLMRMTKFSPQLKTLKLEKDHCVTDHSLTHVAQNCSRLETFELTGNNYISAASLIAISIGCERLQYLSLTKVWATDEAISSIATYCLSLQSIALCGNYSIGDSSLSLLFQRCTQLRNVVLKDLTEVTDQSLQALAAHSQLLQSVELFLLPHVTEEGIEGVLRGCGVLQRMSLYASTMTRLGQTQLRSLRPDVAIWIPNDYFSEVLGYLDYPLPTHLLIEDHTPHSSNTSNFPPSAPPLHAHAPQTHAEEATEPTWALDFADIEAEEAEEAQKAEEEFGEEWGVGFEGDYGLNEDGAELEFEDTDDEFEDEYWCN